MSAKSTSSNRADFDGKTMAVIARKGYRVENKLGQGAFGVVYKAVHQQTGQLTAVKVISLLKMSERSREKFLPREIQTLIECRHENLVQVFDIFRASAKMDISGYAKKNKGIREELACQWFYQASSGLAYLHEQLYTTHRDIKLDNVLLDGSWMAKLTDFGFAKKCFDPASDTLILSVTFCGTVPYECPQILEHKPYNGFKADIWSMGVSLFIMLHDRFPFHHKDRKLMLQEIKNYPRYLRSRYSKKLPNDANRLVEQLLHPDEAKRASVQTILTNAYLRNRVPN